MFKTWEEFEAGGKDSFDAYIAGSGALTKGFQSVAGEIAAFSQQYFDQAAGVTEQILAAKTLDQAGALQRKFAKDSFDAYVAQMSKLGGIFTETLGDYQACFEKRPARPAAKAAAK